MITKLIEHNSSEYNQMVALRTAILRKPLGLSYTMAQLDAENNDILVGSFEKQNLIGCCILSKIEPQKLQLRQMAVIESHQKRGVGTSIIEFAEIFGVENNFESIMLHARKTAVGFYKKIGYLIIGTEFLEVGIPHYEMIKILNSGLESL